MFILKDKMSERYQFSLFFWAEFVGTSWSPCYILQILISQKIPISGKSVFPVVFLLLFCKICTELKHEVENTFFLDKGPIDFLGRKKSGS